MKDPTRLADPRSRSPASLRRLIQAGRSDVPDIDRLSRLADRLGLGPGVVPAGAAAVKGAAVGLGVGATKIAAVTALVLGAGAGVLVTSNLTESQPAVVASPGAMGGAIPSSREQRPDSEVMAPARSSDERSLPPEGPAPLSASTSVPRDAPATAVAGVASARTTPKDWLTPTAPAAAFRAPPLANQGGGAPTSPPEARSAETEFSLLEEAQRALHSNPQRALDLTERDALRYPSGALAQEREVIGIEALVQLGRASEARSRGKSFFRAFPGSAHRPRIATLLGLDPGVHNP